MGIAKKRFRALAIGILIAGALWFGGLGIRAAAAGSISVCL